MAINLNRYGKKKDSTNRRGGQFYTVPDGKTTLRVFPFTHTVNPRDFELGIYKEGDPDAPKVGEKQEEIDREVMVHFLGKGEQPFNCTLLPDCTGCEKARQYLSSTLEADKQVGRRMSARKQHRVNCVVDNEMKIVTFPPMAFGMILEYILNSEYPDLMGCKGRDFIITRDSKKAPSQMYAVMLRDREKSLEVPDSFLDSVVDLYEMEMFDPDYVKEQSTTNPDPSRGKEFKDDSATLIGQSVTFGEGQSGKITGVEGPLVTVTDAEGGDWEMDRSEFQVVKGPRRK